MTIRFTKVSSAVWRSQRFKCLPTDAARLLYLYFIANEHQNSSGAYRIPDGYAIDDLGWTKEAYIEARAALVAADLILFDGDASTVYVLRWFKHSPPMNNSHAIACRRQISQLESDTIRERVEQDFDTADIDRLEREATARNSIADKSALAGIRGSDRWPVIPGRRAG
jgi:hypothetical protein